MSLRHSQFGSLTPTADVWPARQACLTTFIDARTRASTPAPRSVTGYGVTPAVCRAAARSAARHVAFRHLS